jgi:hypothetical protein
MRKHKRLLLFGLSALLVAVAVGAWLLTPRTAITRENAAKIQVRMSLAEVESIFGGPARDETTGPGAMDAGDGSSTLWLDDVCVLNAFSDPPRPHVWKSDRVLSLVWVDDEMRVANFIAFPQQRAAERPIDTIRRWLGR